MSKAAVKQEPVWISESVTPSGIEVRYSVEPRRQYQVRETQRDGDTLLGASEWFEVPSVTTVNEVLDKPALPWWGMKVGIEGALTMHNMGLLRSMPFQGQRVLACAGPVGNGHSGLVVAGVDEVVELLNKHKLTTNHVKDKAGDRGQAVHDALEVWAKTGSLPDPSIYPPEEQLYVIGLVNFLIAAEPEPVASEVMVGSAEYGFAGRYDIRWRIPKACEVCIHVTPKRGPQYRRLEAGLLLGDLKTSRDVYLETHHRQLEAYEGASVECGYEPTEARGVLLVGLNVKGDDNKWMPAPPYYKFVRSSATFEDFLAVLEVYRSNERMKKRDQAWRKAK